jgi:outer membrane protein
MRNLIIFLSLIGTIINASAQSPLTLEQAIQIGVENSKTLRSSELNVTAAEEKYHEVNSNRFPSLNFSGRYTRLSTVPPFAVSLPISIPGIPNSFVISPNIYNNYNFQLTVQQPIFTGFQLSNAVEAAQKNADAVAFDVRSSRSSLKLQIATSYWNLYRAIQARNFMKENLDRVKLHFKQAQDLYDQGMLTQSDLLSAKVQVSNSELMLMDAENNVRLAAVALNNVIGVPLDREYQITSVPQVSDTSLPDLNKLIETALSNRPDMESMKLRVEAAGAAVKSAWGAFLPQLALVGNYYYSRPNNRILPAVDEFKNTWDVSLALSFNIWNWGKTAASVEQARVQMEQARLGEKQLADGIYVDVTQSFLNFKQAKDKIAVVKMAMKDAEESYRVTDQKFKVGLATNTDLKDAELTLLQAKLNYAQALTDLEIARVNMQRAVGSL